MICGHADEIGFQILFIDPKGFLFFTTVGGSDPALARGQRVHIHTPKGPVLGVIGQMAIHMQDDEDRKKVPKWHEMFIDIGAKNQADAESRVSVGDLATYTVGTEPLTDDLWVARAHDNRIGTFVAAEVLRLCAKEKGLKASVVAASCIQEENGLYGATMLGHSVHPDVALVVDVGHATDTPNTNPKRFGDAKLGRGPLLSRGSVNHPVVVERLEKVAKAKKLPFQRSADPRWSGTDGDAIFLQKGGIPTAVLSIPNRYMHSPVEVVSLSDLKHLAEWLAAFCLDLKTGETFKVKI
jgi:endoglucanase